jgi:hypothetical protein
VRGRGGEPAYQQRIGRLRLVLSDAETSAEEKAKARQEIEALLNQYFDRDIEMRQAKIAEIEQRVAKLKAQLQKRLAAKSELVQLQMKLIENEAAGLGFFGVPEARGGRRGGAGMYGRGGEMMGEGYGERGYGGEGFGVGSSSSMGYAEGGRPNRNRVHPTPKPEPSPVTLPRSVPTPKPQR